MSLRLCAVGLDYETARRAGWLSRLVTWFADSHEETQLNDDSDLEIIDAVAQLQGLYAAARDNVGSSRQKVGFLGFIWASSESHPAATRHHNHVGCV
jgi:hypothetical protein